MKLGSKNSSFANLAKTPRMLRPQKQKGRKEVCGNQRIKAKKLKLQGTKSVIFLWMVWWDWWERSWCFLIYNIEIKCCCRYFQGGIVHSRVEGKEVNDNAIIDDSNFIHSHFMIIFDWNRNRKHYPDQCYPLHLLRIIFITEPNEGLHCCQLSCPTSCHMRISLWKIKNYKCVVKFLFSLKTDCD